MAPCSIEPAISDFRDLQPDGGNRLLRNVGKYHLPRCRITERSEDLKSERRFWSQGVLYNCRDVSL